MRSLRAPFALVGMVGCLFAAGCATPRDRATRARDASDGAADSADSGASRRAEDARADGRQGKATCPVEPLPGDGGPAKDVTGLERVVGKMAATDWTRVEPLYADALCRAAGILSEAGADPGALDSLRGLSGEIATAERLDLDQAARVERGLHLAADALVVALDAANVDAAPGERAKAAVDRVEGDGMLSMQRAAVQDAFRLLVVGLKRLR